MAESRVPKWKVAFVVMNDDNTWRDTDPGEDPREELALQERLTDNTVWRVLQNRTPANRWLSSRVAFGIRPENIQLALEEKHATWLSDNLELPKYIELVHLGSRGSRQHVNWYDVSTREDLQHMHLPDGSDEPQSTTNDSVQTDDGISCSGLSESGGSRTEDEWEQQP